MSDNTEQTVHVAPAPYVTVKMFAAISGLSEKAVRRKMEEGKWVEGRGQTLSFMAVHSSHQAQPTPPGKTSSSSGPNSPRRLNPIFGEWLMGWSLQWTKAEPSASSASETASWRSALQQRLSFLLDGHLEK